MTKKHFIALANHIMYGQYSSSARVPFTAVQIEYLADFCKFQNANFNRKRWIDYINGRCGPNGGKITKKETKCLT